MALWPERERVVHLHAAAALGPGELDRLDHIRDAIRDVRVDAGSLRGGYTTVGVMKN